MDMDTDIGMIGNYEKLDYNDNDNNKNIKSDVSKPEKLKQFNNDLDRLTNERQI